MSNFLNSKHMRNRVIDPVDAQNVNLYFDVKDQFIQRGDPFIRVFGLNLQAQWK
jgi:hypothetical protein